MGKKNRKNKNNSNNNKNGGSSIAAGFRAAAQRSMQRSMNEANIKLDEMCDLPIDKQKECIRKSLISIGTDCNLNDRDPMGDGDQRPILSVNGRDVAREIFSIGGDINGYAESSSFSPFAMACICGNTAFVKKTILDSYSHSVHDNKEEMRKILETRETSLRLSPLLLIASAGKNAYGIPRENHVAVTHLLLKYGANPDAKDVFGKTVCHYGAGAMANPMSMEVADMCIVAARTSYFFGKEIELHGLKTAALNGVKGVAGGFDSNSGRRSIYIQDQEREIWVKPENMRLLAMAASEVDVLQEIKNKPMLVDVQDRMGSVSLHEVIMCDRVDVAEFLLQKHKASIHSEDLDGISPLKLTTQGGAMLSSVSRMVAAVTRKEGGISRKMKKKSQQVCSHCQKDLDKDNLLTCSACNVAIYCGRECQRKHWKNGHKGECQKLGALSAGVKVYPPKTNMATATQSFTTGKVYDKGYYRRPRGVKVNEKFVMKAQAMSATYPILVYDETRTCEFDIPVEASGFGEILAEIQKEKAWDGRKTFMKASFDESDICTFYPATAGVKAKYSW
jgi:hypothetical protein